MPRSQGYSSNLNNRRQSTGLRPFIVLCVISVLLLTFSIREGDAGIIHGARSVVMTVTTPVRYLGSIIASPFNAVGNIASNLTASPATLSDLEAENEELRAKVAELSEAQATAERLESLLGLQSTYSLQSTAARIIGESGDAWSRTVTIDKGSADGLAINMPVCNAGGIIGQIIEVSPTTATVRLVTDENSGISAMVQSTRAQGILQGQPDGTLRLEYVTVDSDVKEGDIIVSSGLGGVYPKGLLLGVVSSVDRPENASYYTIVVTPASSETENNEEVLVITALNDDQVATDAEVSEANAQDDVTTSGGGSTDSGSAVNQADASGQDGTTTDDESE